MAQQAGARPEMYAPVLAFAHLFAAFWLLRMLFIMYKPGSKKAGRPGAVPSQSMRAAGPSRFPRCRALRHRCCRRIAALATRLHPRPPVRVGSRRLQSHRAAGISCP